MEEEGFSCNYDNTESYTDSESSDNEELERIKLQPNRSIKVELNEEQKDTSMIVQSTLFRAQTDIKFIGQQDATSNNKDKNELFNKLREQFPLEVINMKMIVQSMRKCFLQETNKIDLLFVFASPFKNPSHLKHQKLLAPIGHKAEFMTLDDSLKNLKSNVKY